MDIIHLLLKYVYLFLVSIWYEHDTETDMVGIKYNKKTCLANYIMNNEMRSLIIYSYMLFFDILAYHGSFRTTNTSSLTLRSTVENGYKIVHVIIK